jgi:hypothetical protein
MIRLEDLLRELKLGATNRWEDYDLKSLDPKTLESMFVYYKSSYESEGLDLSVNSPQELQADYKAVAMIDVDRDRDPDSFIIYKPTPYGNKISLLFTNRAPGAAKAVILKMLDLVNTTGWFIEASKKTEDILSKAGAPVIEDEDVIKGIIGPKKAATVRFKKDGYYERELGAVPGKFITKRLYGISK